jgi:hypothetical protein
MKRVNGYYERMINYIQVFVVYSSSDIILWKACGAISCASGEFYNLRRLSPSRCGDPDGGGGQLPYTFEEYLFTSLRV